MADHMFPTSIESLTDWILRELDQRKTIFGLPEDLFIRPAADAPYRTRQYGRRLDTPLGVAAGPHTQLVQNIVTAYLAGARFIELKTVQTLDQLEVSKPCIDMEDVGYNCEWSQELPLEQSFGEYLKAWILIRGLARHLDLGADGDEPGFLFNMSVGYNLEGIHRDNVQQFLERMNLATQAQEQMVRAAAGRWPIFDGLDIPDRLSESITLSTMHGCPPDEIERIARYLIEERGLHTSVKLNPTLLGPGLLREILHGDLGFDDIEVPDEAFEHDPGFDDALTMIRSLAASARDKGVFFGVKLTNTLETRNLRKVLPERESMHYMSGRALHPLAVQLASRLHAEFAGSLPISLSGGGDAFNLPGLIAAGLSPVTVCSDLLRPGGYGRLPQYLENLEAAMRQSGSSDAGEFTRRVAASDPARLKRAIGLLPDWFEGTGGRRWDEATAHRLHQLVSSMPKENLAALLTRFAEQEGLGEGLVDLFSRTCRQANLEALAEEARKSERYQKPRRRESTKTLRPLDFFDCIDAPCRSGCPAHQNIPDYMYLVARGRYEEALETILRTNPLPAITGAVCDHPCMTKCVRSNYDRPLAIREIKRFVTERMPDRPAATPGRERAVSVAVVGAGPAGLAVAWYLGLAGVRVTVYDSRDEPGGVPARMIPAYRLAEEKLAQDIEHIRALGVEFRFGVSIGRDLSFDELRQGSDYVYIGAGAAIGVDLRIEGTESAGVFDCLEFLTDVRSGCRPELGRRVLVIGGGNSAMDAARTAWRLVGESGQVELVYRRSAEQMPADDEEISALRAEGVTVRELHSPIRVVVNDSGVVSGLECIEMELGEPDKSGRPRPLERPGTEKVLPADSIVVAVGQKPDADFLVATGLDLTRWGTVRVAPDTFETSIRGVFAGGDVVRGGGSIIRAAADAHAAAVEMLRREGMAEALEPVLDKEGSPNGYLVRRSRRIYPDPIPELALEERRSFDPVGLPLSESQAQREAGRCLDCDEFCALCVTVCPNRANLLYTRGPLALELPVFRALGPDLDRIGTEAFAVVQGPQIVNFADWCNECGNCETFCPSSGAPYRDKPRLCVSDESFKAEARALRLWVSGQNDWRLIFKDAERNHELTRRGQEISYASELIEARLAAADFAVLDARPGPALGEGQSADLKTCAIMFVLADGLAKDAPFLPGLVQRD